MAEWLWALSCRWIANKFGLINTMVFTHLPSNALTILIPLMPTMELASAMVFLRCVNLFT